MLGGAEVLFGSYCFFPPRILIGEMGVFSKKELLGALTTFSQSTKNKK